MNLGILEGFCPERPEGPLGQAVCFASAWEIPLGVLLVALLVGGVVIWRRVAASRALEEGTPILVFDPQGGSGVAVRRAQDFGGSRAARRVPGEDARAPHRRSPPPAGNGEYRPPQDGTLQLLPGQLRILSGPGAGEEVRFVRLPGGNAEVTFGREEGEEFRHVQLRSPTVSRLQARMIHHRGRWVIRNESSTNPTRLNGQALGPPIESHPLSDGDELEMGEVVLRFHQEMNEDRLPHRSSWYTDRGRRSSNQDAVAVKSLPDGRELAVVCDGMGSHHAGGAASHLAVETLVRELSNPATGLEAAVHAAHQAILRGVEEEADRKGMGTTLVALLRQGPRYRIANVGDSRAYRLGPDELVQLTQDHSFMAEARETGRLSEEELERSPFRHAVTRYLGSEEPLEVELLGDFDGAENHLVILSTDGVHGVLDEERLLRICRETPDVRDLARALSEAALMEGGEDNVAVAVMAFGEDAIVPSHSGTERGSPQDPREGQG